MSNPILVSFEPKTIIFLSLLLIFVYENKLTKNCLRSEFSVGLSELGHCHKIAFLPLEFYPAYVKNQNQIKNMGSHESDAANFYTNTVEK